MDEGLTARDVREQVANVQETISVIEWCMAGIRELLNERQVYIQLGDRKVSAVAVLAFQSDLVSMVNALRLKIRDLDAMRVVPHLRGGDV